MLATARDVYALFFLERQLGILREEYLTRAIDGTPPPPEFWEREEGRVLEELRRLFYSREARLLVKPAVADKVSDSEDFANRTQRLLEFALLMTHRKLLAIPFVGQMESAEE